MHKKLDKGAMQGPLGDIGRHRDFLLDYLGDTGRHRYFKELLGDIGGHGDGDYSDSNFVVENKCV